MDVDFFKQYNDTYGHQMGDNVLKLIAQALKQLLQRGDDYCFRLGGEEFAGVFYAEEHHLAYRFAESIRSSIEALKIPHIGSNVSDCVTVSIGIVCKNANEIKDADEIYKETDDLLYEAKRLNRNQVMINEQRVSATS